MRVALVTIGDELLAGETENTNAAWLGRRLTERGVRVERMTVVPDRVEEIASVVDEYRTSYDAVITTGGIGPTHDDVTMRAVAEAFGVDLETSQDALEWIEDHHGYTREDLTEETADIPAGARMLRNRVGVAPGCALSNVYVLPGVPEEMTAMFEEVVDDFIGEEYHVETVYAAEPESSLISRIEQVRDRFDVAIGSYPGEVVRLKLSGSDGEQVEAAAKWLSDIVESPDDPPAA